MKLNALLALALLVVAGLACVTPDRQSGSNSNEPALPPITITAVELVQAYMDNEVRADEKYKGRTVIVTGSVSEVSKDVFDNAYVSLKGPPKEMFRDLYVYFKDSSKLSSLNKGTSLTVKGQCRGLMGPSVAIHDGEIQ